MSPVQGHGLHSVPHLGRWSGWNHGLGLARACTKARDFDSFHSDFVGKVIRLVVDERWACTVCGVSEVLLAFEVFLPCFAQHTPYMYFEARLLDRERAKNNALMSILLLSFPVCATKQLIWLGKAPLIWWKRTLTYALFGPGDELHHHLRSSLVIENSFSMELVSTLGRKWCYNRVTSIQTRFQCTWYVWYVVCDSHEITQCLRRTQPYTPSQTQTHTR